MAIPAERLEADGIRHLERLTALKAHYAAKGLPSGVTNTPLPHIGERDSSRMTTEAQRRKANAGQPSNPPATIKIVLEASNRRGRSRSLPRERWVEVRRPPASSRIPHAPPRRNSPEGDSGARCD